VPLGVAGDEGGTGHAHGARYEWDVFGSGIEQTSPLSVPYRVTLRGCTVASLAHVTTIKPAPPPGSKPAIPPIRINHSYGVIPHSKVRAPILRIGVYAQPAAYAAAVHAQVKGLQAGLRVELAVVALVPVSLGVGGEGSET
jgi:hypothetical protein